MPKRVRPPPDPYAPTSPEGWRILRHKRLTIEARWPGELGQLSRAQADALRGALGEDTFNRMSAFQRGIHLWMPHHAAAHVLLQRLLDAGCAAELHIEHDHQILTATGGLGLIFEEEHEERHFIRRLLRLGVVIEDAPASLMLVRLVTTVEDRVAILTGPFLPTEHRLRDDVVAAFGGSVRVREPSGVSLLLSVLDVAVSQPSTDAIQVELAVGLPAGVSGVAVDSVVSEPESGPSASKGSG